MNQRDLGACWTNNVDYGKYNVPTDASGNSVLTGDGSHVKGNKKHFTATEIEVYLLE